MKQWMRAGIAVAALALAVAAGTGAYAMRGGSDGSPKSAAADDSAAEQREAGGGASTMAVCAPGYPGCNDMIVEDGGDVANDACPADGVCDTPRYAEQLGCAEGLTIAECFPDGVPAGYDCAELESFPVQVVCKSIGQCGEPIPMPYEIDPMPAPDVESGDGGGDDPVTILPAPAPDEVVDPIDPNTTIVERVEECPPLPEPCSDTTDPAVSGVRCLPRDCAVSSDGSVACPEPCVVTTDPMAGIAENECTSPPGCQTFEDGSVACPGSPGEGEPGCVGGPAVDCAPIGEPVPCEGGPAVDCGPVDLPLTEPGECVGGPAIDCPAEGDTQADRDARAAQ